MYERHGSDTVYVSVIFEDDHDFVEAKHRACACRQAPRNPPCGSQDLDVQCDRN